MIARRIRRPGIALLLMATAVVAALLPPAHVHLAVHDHDHDDHDHQATQATVEHSHWSGHHTSGAAFDDADDEGRVLFVDHPSIVSAAVKQIGVPQAALIALLTIQYQSSFEASAQRGAGNAPRDGPARQPHTLRGPPTVSFK